MRKLAYVIGINNYEKWTPLKNPVNDAETMKEVLERTGFNVKVFLNLNYVQLSSCIAEFKYELREYGAGLFYFAGHGIEIDGDNYLIPLNADMETSRKIATSSINLSYLTKDFLETDDGVFIIILDACRTRISLDGYRGYKETGLTSLKNAPLGTFISFSTGPDSKASDGDGSNGLFTKVLSKYILEKNLKIEEVFKRVRKEVATISKRNQIPWEHSSLIGDFYFREPDINSSINSILPGYHSETEEYFSDYLEDDVIEDNNKKFDDIVTEFNQRIKESKYEEFYIVCKTKTLAYRKNTIQWWCSNGNGYTDDLSQAGTFSKDYIKKVIKPYNHYMVYTKSFAVPVRLVENLFNQSIIPYNENFIEKFFSVEEEIIGDLNWNLPRIMY
ncbi:caspase family protein [Clostridium botulinum]|nr:caspase family protein [Clostridium botulinum]